MITLTDPFTFKRAQSDAGDTYTHVDVTEAHVWAARKEARVIGHYGTLDGRGDFVQGKTEPIVLQLENERPDPADPEAELATDYDDFMATFAGMSSFEQALIDHGKVVGTT